MLAPPPQNMLNMLAVSNPMANGFTRARRAATAAGFIGYSGIISARSLYGCGWVTILRFNSEPSPQLCLSL
jgi:hypothetical protein